MSNNYILNQLLEINFATHLAMLFCFVFHLETPDFIRPLVGHVINGGKDL